MDDTTLQILFGLAIPLVVAGLLLVPGSRHWCDAGRRRSVHWRVPTALALPIVIAFFGLYGRPSEQWQHAVFVPAVGLLIGLWMAWSSRRPSLRALQVVILSVLGTAVIWPVLRQESWLIRLVPVVSILVLTALLEPLTARRASPAVAVGLLISAGVTAAIVLQSGFLKLTVALAAMIMAMGVLAVVGLWRRGVPLADGGLAVVVPALVVVSLVAWLYMIAAADTVPRLGFILPLAAPVGMWLGELPGIRGRPVVRSVVQLAAVAVICGVAIGIAFSGGDGAIDDDPYADMYRDMMGQ